MSKLIKSTAILFILTIVSKVIGFCRETILVSTYGASMISDVYITSMKIPIVCYDCFSAFYNIYTEVL